MCRTGGRRCEATWDTAHVQRAYAQRRRNRNQQKAAEARAAGDPGAAAKYDVLRRAAAAEFHAIDTAIQAHQATTAVPSPDAALSTLLTANRARGAKKLLDAPLAEHLPPAVRDRITSPEYQDLRARERATAAALHQLRARRTAGHPVDPAQAHRVYDAHKAARAATLNYRMGTARLLDGTATTTDRDFTAPNTMAVIGEADSGTEQWLRMRQPTVGGSDVGAICQVGAYGAAARAQVRDSKTDPDPQTQEHNDHSYIGDVWEPHLVSIATTALGQQAYTNKATRSDGACHVNLDAFTIDEVTGKVNTVVEMKTSSHPEDWEDAPPPGYVLQTQHYMHNLDARAGILIAAVNDERLVVYDVAHDDTVPAGATTPKKLGGEFSYRDVKEYTETTVAGWNTTRTQATTAGPRRPRQRFELTAQEKTTWRRALDEGAVFVDLETSTRSPTTGHIIEFAGVDDQGHEFQRLYGVPADHSAWNGTGAVDVHHITPPMIRGQPMLLDSESARAEIREFIGERVLIAHNAAFERSWLEENQIPVDTACTQRAFGATVDDDAIPDNTMRSFTEWSGHEYRDAHRAMPDVKMMRRAFERLRPYLDAATRS